MKPHRGTLILVLGILSLVICYPLGFVTWVMANGDLKEIASGAMDPEGKQLTTIGKILGIIASIFFIIGLVGIILMALLGGLTAVVGTAAQ